MTAVMDRPEPDPEEKRRPRRAPDAPGPVALDPFAERVYDDDPAPPAAPPAPYEGLNTPLTRLAERMLANAEMRDRVAALTGHIRADSVAYGLLRGLAQAIEYEREALERIAGDLRAEAARLTPLLSPPADPAGPAGPPPGR